MRADNHGYDQQDEAVNRHTPRQKSAFIGGVLLGQQQEYRAASNRIHDWKQCADDEQDTFGYFEEHIVREYTRIARGILP